MISARNADITWTLSSYFVQFWKMQFCDLWGPKEYDFFVAASFINVRINHKPGMQGWEFIYLLDAGTQA